MNAFKKNAGRNVNGEAGSILNDTELCLDKGVHLTLAMNRISFESLLYILWIDKADEIELKTKRRRDLLAWQVVTRNKLLNKVLAEPGDQGPRVQRTSEQIRLLR